MPQPTPGVSAAIAAAARLTGASASYLTATARRESSFDPNAEAATSSASGLFQFIESTWLTTLNNHAQSLGLETEAALPREQALQLRFDPKLAALMAGALAADNADVLEANLGRVPSEGDLYAAHVLGAGGAVRLIEARDADPAQAAAELFPAAARANRGLFFAKDGAPVSAGDLYKRLASSLSGEAVQASASASPTGGVESGAVGASSREGSGGAGGFRGARVFTTALKLTPQTIEILGLLGAPERAKDDDDASRSRDDNQNDRRNRALRL